MDHLHIPPFAEATAAATRRRMNSLAKLEGSLGVLEDLAVRLAGITDQECPSFPNRAAVLFAADHDIVLQGASASPQEVTRQQVINFCHGGGAINAFCRTAQASFTAVDVGMKVDVTDDQAPGLVQRKVVYAARDFSQGPAMSRDEAQACLQVGIDMAREKAAAGVQLLAAGEMGIGNTSPCAAITSLVTGLPVEEVTGMGAFMAPAALQRKTALIKKGLEVNRPDPADPLDMLAKVGGPEIAAMAGLMLGGASLRIPVVIDGLIAGVAAAMAILLKPACRDMLVGSHVSAAPGHRQLVQKFGIPTYLDLDMRLGEGTGAVLLFPMIDTAVRILTEMPTLETMSTL